MAAKDTQDAGYGCLLGACVGDAAGATLEFLGRLPEPDEVAASMRMNGGGCWSVAPGQITDDCELALCLAHGLSQGAEFSLEAIATQYARWIESPPFDIGNTTSASLGCFRKEEWRKLCEKQGYAVGMSEAAQQFCTQSKSNGSLMRCTPLGIWGYRLSDEKLAEYAHADSGLSHPNQSCRDSVACYIIAVASLLREPGDNQKAFQRAFDWAQSNACEDVKNWMQDTKQGVVAEYYPMAGFVRIGLMHAFRHLRLGTSYEEAIRETLLGGGDTDTNACIVGGLLGAFWGADALPTWMTAPVLQCDTTRGRVRPDFLHTTQLPQVYQRLMEAAPA